MAACGVIRRGFSTARDPATAVREFSEAIAQPDIGLIVFFCSFTFDLDVLEPELQRAFEGLHVIGCTTAGEIAPTGYLDGAITGFSIKASHCRAVSAVMNDLSHFQISDGHAATQKIVAAMKEKGLALDPKDTFAMLLIDGMSGNEEVVLSSVQLLMDMIPLLGGSAADNLSLTGAYVYFEGAFHRDAALLTAIKIKAPFRIVKCQHFVDSDVRMVVTRADPFDRKVVELNAEPAASEYARMLDIPEQALTPTVFSAFPLLVKIGGDFHVRSIRAAHPDHSLTFFCAIDEGVVLRLAKTEAILPNLTAFFQSVKESFGTPELVIGFDCIHRGLSLEKAQTKRLASDVLAANNVIGFCTYGEQFAGMHLNQTFTAVAIGGVMTPIDAEIEGRADAPDPADAILESARLRAEIEKLRRINDVLMDRVENDLSAKGHNAFTLFQAAITLENRVAERTAELTHLTHQLFQQISERRAAEKALLLAKGEAEKANLSKTRFLAAASHDLHQPLNIARLFLGMLLQHIETVRGRELADGIEAALNTVDELLGALLDISRLDAGVWPVEMTTFRLQPLLDRLRQNYEPQAEAAGLRLRVAPSSAVIRSDRALLERVLCNLVSNALRYTAQGSVLIGCRRRGGAIAIEVRDTGIGIAEDHLETIFEEFKQVAAGARERERGLGLGLAISERIARLIDAKIDVASTLGRGSVFAVCVKAGDASDAPAGEEREADPAPLAGLCIVAIDDDAQVREALESQLRSWDCVPVVERSAKDAIAKLRAARKFPQIIIADYHLDGDDLGTDAVAALRASFGEGAPALIISSDARAELRRRLERLGFSFLAKPTAPMNLRAMLTSLAARQLQAR